MSGPKLSDVAKREIIGEVGVERHIEHVLAPNGHLDDDYNDFNPDGSMYGHRNYEESIYVSGTGHLMPGEYPVNGRVFYRDYAPREMKAPEKVVPPGSTGV